MSIVRFGLIGIGIGVVLEESRHEDGRHTLGPAGRGHSDLNP